MCITVELKQCARSLTVSKPRITVPLEPRAIVQNYHANPRFRLPAELFRPIIEEITHQPTLHALALTCRFLHSDTQRQLYAHIPATPSFSSCRSPSPTSAAVAAPQMHISFLRTITTLNPSLALLVKSYHSPSIVSYHESPLWTLTLHAFRMMRNLKHLHFRAFGGHPAAAELLWGCEFRLETLVWGSHSDEAAFGRVLEEQSFLKELYLECRSGVGNLNALALFSAAACPCLTALGGNRMTVEALLPGRAVRQLTWVPNLEDDNGPPVVGMDNELGNLKTLSFGGYFSRPKLEILIYQLQGLEVLELVGLDNLSELNLIKDIKNLRELVFSVRGGSPKFPLPLKGRDLIVRRLFTDCPRLACIDIAHDWPNVDEIRYQRWRRGEVNPVTVMTAEIRAGRFGFKY